MPELEGKEVSEQIEKLTNRIEELHEKTKRDWISYLPILTAILTLFIAIFTTIVNFKINALKEQQHEAEAKLDREQQGATFSLALIHEVISTVGDNNANDKKVTAVSGLLAFLQDTYADDKEKEPLKLLVGRLIELLPHANQVAAFAQDTQGSLQRAQARENAQSEAPPAAAQSATSLSAVQQPDGTLFYPGDPKGWDYDIFSCQQQAAADPLARKLFDALTTSGDRSLGLVGRVRLRSLPAEINKGADYQIYDSVAIKSSPDKFPQAQKLQTWANKVLGGQLIRIDQSDKKLPWYLSLFVCKSPAT